jgi:hypothetical protein
MTDLLKSSWLAVALISLLAVIQEAGADCNWVEIERVVPDGVTDFDGKKLWLKMEGSVRYCESDWGVSARLKASGLRPGLVYTAWWVVHEPFDACADYGTFYWMGCWDTTSELEGHPPAAAHGRLGSDVADAWGRVYFRDALAGFRPGKGTSITLLLVEDAGYYDDGDLINARSLLGTVLLRDYINSEGQPSLARWRRGLTIAAAPVRAE